SRHKSKGPACAPSLRIPAGTVGGPTHHCGATDACGASCCCAFSSGQPRGPCVVYHPVHDANRVQGESTSVCLDDNCQLYDQNGSQFGNGRERSPELDRVTFSQG